MSDKKHIDRLFQERFKNFEVTPSDAVWENIEAELNKKKKKRRVIPIWWRYAGVAALLLLLLTVGGLLTGNDSQDLPNNQVVVETEAENPEKSNTSEDNNATNNFKKGDDITDVKDAVAESNIENESDKKASEAKTDKDQKNITPSNQTSVAENISSKHKNKGTQQTQLPSNKKSNANNIILNTDNKAVIAENSKEKTNEGIQNKTPQIDINKANEIISNATKNNTAVADVKQNDISANPIPKIDKTAKTNTDENTLTIEDALNNNKDIIEEEKDENISRWSIAPNAAPVYFSSLGDGSSIDPQFNNNSKSGELNMSYGIKASYAVNKKLSIRTGINKVNLGYNTNNVVVFQSLSASASSLQNVTTNNNTVNAVSVISSDNLSSAKSPEVFSKNSNTSINQDMGYIEVPLEIQYALINKKLGVNLIGGFSSFFLNKNEIFSESAGSRTLLGEASNINKVSYSANFGFGLNYKVSKKIDLNFEPMFKYQINTFNNTSGNFKPYFIGVYTGFAIKF